MKQNKVNDKFYNVINSWFKFIEYLVIFSFLAFYSSKTHNLIIQTGTIISYIAICLYFTFKSLDLLDQYISFKMNKYPFISALIFMLTSATIWTIINQVLEVFINTSK